MDFLERLHIIHSYTGLFHTLTAILSMIFGTAGITQQEGHFKAQANGEGLRHQYAAYDPVFICDIQFWQLFALPWLCPGELCYIAGWHDTGFKKKASRLVCQALLLYVMVGSGALLCLLGRVGRAFL